MSLLWRLVFFSRCTSTHHKLALDALRFVRGPQADLWTNLFLANHEQYLTGSKAPDNEFKDFKNHVLHVQEGFWGGATTSAREWYHKTVTALNQGDWPEAIYNAGVLSHYFTDPFQPFHTGQTEAEGKVHRAAEWSICRSYDELKTILEQDLTGYPETELTQRPDWLEEAIRQGAIEAHQSYDVCINHYDLSRGIKNPPSGLDQEMKDRLARLIGLAVVGFARVLERAFEESGASPPDVAVSLHVFLATLKMPLNWITRKLTDLQDRAVVEAIYLEAQEKGRVIDALPEDERLVRKLHAQEVLKIPVRQLDAEPAGTTGTQYGTGTPPRGQSAQPTTPAGFQRTVTSAPHWVDAARGPVAPIESCLMVPLAATAPVNYVADAAVRAYLATPPKRPSNDVADAASVSEVTVAASNSVEAGHRLVANAASLADAGSIRHVETRLKRRQRPVDIEPAIMAPTPAVNWNHVNTALTEPEITAEMFGPLPAMPRIPTRDRPPQTSAPQQCTPIPVQPVSRVAEIPSRPLRPVAAPAAEIAPGEPKIYQAQPPAASVVPAPHVRVSSPHDFEALAAEDQSSGSPRGQVEGFDFQSFSTMSAAEPYTTGPTRSNPAPFRQSVVEAQLSAPHIETHSADRATSRRFYLELDSPVVDAPSIGPKTAERLEKIGIHTVSDLLRADARQAAIQMGNPAAETVIREWQAQTSLVCRVPNLRGHDAQFLVACQVLTPEQLRGCEPRALLQQVSTFLRTSAGQRVLRGGTAPDLTEVTEWIIAARDARSLEVI